MPRLVRTSMKSATLLRSVALGLALAAALWAGFWLWSGMTMLAIAGALLIALVHVPAMAAEFAWLRFVNRGDPAPRPTVPELLRAWVAEAAGALVVFGWQMPWRSERFGDHLPAGAAGRRGLLLVHGFVCNRGLWNRWWPRLRAAGVPCIALNLDPVFASIDDHVPRIDAAVRRLSDATGRAPLLVGHSMGGLALRAWLRGSGNAERMRGLVTIGTPHHGTVAASLVMAPNTVQMRRNSRWLEALSAGESAALRGRFTCFYGHCDNIVMPCSSATLRGADNRHLHGHAHVHLLQHPDVLAEVLRRLDEPDQPTANSRSPGSTTPASTCGSERTSA